MTKSLKPYSNHKGYLMKYSQLGMILVIGIIPNCLYSDITESLASLNSQFNTITNTIQAPSKNRKLSKKSQEEKEREAAEAGILETKEPEQETEALYDVEEELQQIKKEDEKKRKTLEKKLLEIKAQMNITEDDDGVDDWDIEDD
jgi:hypothetical protein